MRLDETDHKELQINLLVFGDRKLENEVLKQVANLEGHEERKGETTYEETGLLKKNGGCGRGRLGDRRDGHGSHPVNTPTCPRRREKQDNFYQ